MEQSCNRTRVNIKTALNTVFSDPVGPRCVFVIQNRTENSRPSASYPVRKSPFSGSGPISAPRDGPHLRSLGELFKGGDFEGLLRVFYTVCARYLRSHRCSGWGEAFQGRERQVEWWFTYSKTPQNASETAPHCPDRRQLSRGSDPDRAKCSKKRAKCTQTAPNHSDRHQLSQGSGPDCHEKPQNAALSRIFAKSWTFWTLRKFQHCRDFFAHSVKTGELYTAACARI